MTSRLADNKSVINKNAHIDLGLGKQSATAFLRLVIWHNLQINEINDKAIASLYIQ
jgi:hypothetical protein